MSNWKKGATPNGEVVVRFADHFHVSTDYLLKGSESSASLLFEDPTVHEILSCYSEFSELEKKVLLGKVAELTYYKKVLSVSPIERR